MEKKILFDENWAKRISDRKIRFAPVDMSEAERVAQGYYRYDSTKPEKRDGYIAVHKDYIIDHTNDGDILRSEYEYVAIKPKAAKYKVCELFWWIAQKGKATQLDDFLKSQGLYSAAITQTEVSDDDENFTSVVDAVKVALSLTDDEINDCLTQAKIK